MYISYVYIETDLKHLKEKQRLKVLKILLSNSFVTMAKVYTRDYRKQFWAIHYMYYLY